MSRSSPDESVEMGVNERQRRARAPVTEQAVLDVVGLERLAQQGIALQIDHPEREVVTGAPEGVHAPQLVRAQRRTLDSGARLAERAQAGVTRGIDCTHRSSPKPPAALAPAAPSV